MERMTGKETVKNMEYLFLSFFPYDPPFLT